MKTADMRELINSQRYFLIALSSLIGSIEDPQIKNLVTTNINNLWVTTEILDESLKLKLSSIEDIIKHGNEMMALAKMYGQEYDKDRVN